MTATLTDQDLTLTAPASGKMNELFKEVDENIKGVRVFVTPGGCSGVSFGMTFAENLEEDDSVLNCEGFDIIVDSNTLKHIRGVEVDFVDQGNGNESFVFNNVQPVEAAASGSGCGGCASSSSAGGGCS
jgi:iron-sulfur cluster insertion protein